MNPFQQTKQATQPNPVASASGLTFDCASVQSLLGLADTATGLKLENSICSEVAQVVSAGEAGTDAQVKRALDFYNGSLAPCLTNVCAKTPYPVTQQQLAQIPKTAALALVRSQFSKTQLFFLRYGQWVTLAMGIVILGLLAALVTTALLGRKKCRNPA
jgi:hypothetical protein